MLPGLTDRETQILDLIADGLTNQEISRRLVVSEATVENHIHHIFVKLGISNRAQAVAYAYWVKIVLVNEMLENNLVENGGNPS
jgi:ATP/maltotriose-dependent transcriptional regulator MalT